MKKKLTDKEKKEFVIRVLRTSRDGEYISKVLKRYWSLNKKSLADQAREIFGG